MIAILIERYRFLRAWWRWVARARRQAAGLEALFATERDPLLVVSSLDPAEVGRQPRQGDAIKDVAAWLAASGFADRPVGYRQCYALWLMDQRDAYERGEVRTS